MDFYPTLATMERLRNELGADFRGMDPIDSRRAPIAMSILRYAAQNLSIAEIERAVRSAIGFPNLPAAGRRERLE